MKHIFSQPNNLSKPFSTGNQNINQYRQLGNHRIEHYELKQGYGNPYEGGIQPSANYNPKANYHYNQPEQDSQDLNKERGRKKFPAKQTEIKQANIFSTPQDPLTNYAGINGEKPYFDRNLDTFDIPGSQPGTLQSKVVKNKEMAHKINNYNQKLDKSQDPMRDSLDVFQRNYQENKNIIPNEIFDERAFSSQHKFGQGLNETPFEEEKPKKENFQIPAHANNFKAARQNNEGNFYENEKENEREHENEENNNNEKRKDEEFENFRSNFMNFYRGYTPDDSSKRNYGQAKRILKAYENIKGDLQKIDKDKEKRIKEDPSFSQSVRSFFAIEDENLAPKKKTPAKNPQSKRKDVLEEEKEIAVLQKEISETEQRLRNLYMKKTNSRSPLPKAEVPKKINPTFLSYAGSEISYGINNNKKKYEVDVIGNIIKRNDELDRTYHTIDGIKRFGAGLKNLNNETTMNPIPQRYANLYQS